MAPRPPAGTANTATPEYLPGRLAGQGPAAPLAGTVRGASALTLPSAARYAAGGSIQQRQSLWPSLSGSACPWTPSC